jgi:hypothetical protein
MAQLHSHHEESLTFHGADGHRVGAVSLVYGNDGYGVLPTTPSKTRWPTLSPARGGWPNRLRRRRQL